MVLMVGGKIIQGGNNYNTLLTTMSEEKEDVESVEAEVVDDDDDEFSNFVKNQLPKQIIREECKTDPPGANSPRVKAAKAAVAAAVAGIDDDDDDDGGGKPAAKQTRAPRTPKEKRIVIDPDKDAKWLAIVDQLKEFKRINGHCNVPYLRPPHLTTLMSWCHSQRRLYRTGKLHPSRQLLLESIGFRWNAPKGRGNTNGTKWAWKDRFEQLKRYKEAHGTLTVERETLVEEEMQLINWCQTQRLNYHAAKMDADKIQQLDSLGFDWAEPYVSQKRDPEKRALVLVGGSSPPANPPAKRTKLNNGKHAPAEVAIVERPPTPTPEDEGEWVEMLEKLKSIKAKKKELPSSFPDDKALERWVRHQKQMLRKEDLPRARMERLVPLGFKLPAGTTLANYRRKPPPAPKASPKKSPLHAQKGPGGSATAAAQPAPGAAKALPTAAARATQATKGAPSKFPPAPPGIIPGAPPAAAVPPGAYPGMPWNPFMLTNPYGPPGMYPPPPNPYGPPPPNTAGKKAGSPAAPNNQLALAPKDAQAQQDSLLFLQQENAQLRAQNEKLEKVHGGMMTSLEEEKMIRRQGAQDLQTKLEKQEQIITTQGSTIKKQGQQIKQLMDQVKDAVSRLKTLERYQEEQERAKEEQRRIQQEEERRQQEIQRQREMQEQQRQREEAEQLRRHQQEEQRRQSELHFLRTQFGL